MLLRFARYTENVLLDTVLDPGQLVVNTTGKTLHVGDGTSLGGISVSLPEAVVKSLIDEGVQLLDTNSVPELAGVL